MGKITYEFVKKHLKYLGYDLISQHYIKSSEKLTLRDNDGYYYFAKWNSIQQKSSPEKFSVSNPYTIQNIKLWCELNDKPFELLSIKYNNNHEYLIWKCLKANCEEIFKMNWNNIQNNRGCPYCTGLQVGLSNCLATKNPELAKQWHPTLNGDLTPYDVTCGIIKKVWWQCDKDHEWKASIANRCKNRGCPYCSGVLPTIDNNLLVKNPILCMDWHYKKNEKQPYEYCPNSGKKVWWKCNECGHEWKAVIYSRNYGIGCPACSESKGEKQIRLYLKLNNIQFIYQKVFDGLLGIGNGLLSYDFYLPDSNLLIEYQGEHHEKPIDFEGRGLKHAKKMFEYQQEHDRRKRQYAKDNGIELLEIWYWDYDNIEKILSDKLKI